MKSDILESIIVILFIFSIIKQCILEKVQITSTFQINAKNPEFVLSKALWTVHNCQYFFLYAYKGRQTHPPQSFLLYCLSMSTPINIFQHKIDVFSSNRDIKH